jgi:hypothetical protein
MTAGERYGIGICGGDYPGKVGHALLQEREKLN